MKKIFTIAIIALSLNAFAQISSDSLKAWYPFNGNANDASGNGNNGTVNGAILTTDRFGNANSAYSFDGVDDYIFVPDNSTFNFGKTDFSFSFWLKYTTQVGGYDDYSSILTKADPSYPYTGLTFFVEQPINGKVLFRTGALNSLDSKSSNLNNNTWTHYAGKRNGNIFKLFINGIMDTTITTTTIDSISNNFDLYIGGHCTDMLAQKFNGLLDDIRIYNRVLDSAEINSLYNENLCYQTITVTDTLIINTNLTGFNPVAFENTIKIYPNPTSDHITIDFGSNYATMNCYTLKISNSLSQIVYTTSISTQQTTVDLSTWSGNGIYFVHLIDAQSNTIDIRKIILQ